MLIRFSVENFRSFKERQELSLVASSLKDVSSVLIDVDGANYKLLRVAAIYGANASGKTNVLRSLDFICSAVRDSQRKWSPEGKIDVDTFRLGDGDLPTSFEVEFLVQNVRYRYGFSLDAQQIIEEWLHAYPAGKQQTWFARNANSEKPFSFSRSLVGENRSIEALTRKNSLFLSAAAQNNHQMLQPIYDWFANKVEILRGPRVPFHVDDETLEYCKAKDHRDTLLRFLAAADLGISNFRVIEEEAAEEFKKFIRVLKEAFPTSEANIPDKVRTLVLLHRAEGKEAVEFPVQDESAGTIAYFALLGRAITALESGGVFCVDELDSSLHPLLALELVKLFNDEKRNPRGAQLIFNTHDTNLLDNSVLRRDQIWFTEKDVSGATHLYPLSDFTPRRNENLKRGYLQGRYGAVPFIGEMRFDSGSVASEDAKGEHAKAVR